MIFCNVMPCTVVGRYQSLKETICLHLDSRIPSTLKMETNYTVSHPRRLSLSYIHHRMFEIICTEFVKYIYDYK